MAARWGTGEEALLACNLDLFPLETLDEESLQSCIDPSILSIFDDVPTLEAKGFDEESEATLLTALTEILDNVDDENLSPFDTLPDSDMLSKGREHSPNLSRMQGGCVQRSDGEEEEDGSFTQSPDRLESSPDPPGWEGLPLPLPILLEQEGQEGLSVSLADLVRHMHPYCMAISVENEEGEQMLPEGGIVLEVVDQSENGEPIFTIPNMDLSYSLHQPLTENEVKPEAAEDELADSSEHIVVDDEDDVPVRKTFEIAPADTPVVCLDVSNKVKRKKERKTTSPARRKKKCNEKQQSELVEGRVLRSGTVRRVITDPPKKPQKGSGKEKVQKSQKVMSASSPPEPLLKPEGIKQIKTEKENTTAAQAPETNEKLVSPLLPEWSATLTPEESRLTCSAVAVSSHQPSKTPKQSATAPEIEAADLTSLLEQFEETQKEEKCVPEVSGRAAAVGNSLAPKTTSPNQMWKPLAPVALLGKPNNPEAPKSTPYKVIQIEAKPLPPVRVRSKATPAAAPVAPDVACMDHDYCLSNKSVSLGESGKRWNIKQQSVFTIKPLYRHRNSDSSLSSSSRSSSRSSPSLSRSPPRRRRYSYSSSRSGSWSRSTSRSPSPQRQAQWSRSRYCTGTKTNVEETKRRKEKAIEERRVVYVGKIRGSMTQRELRERFSLFGEIEECTLHFREHRDNYGFITYYNTKDAFTAIENGSKLRKPDELPFDLCFGGRRQFCQSNYADLSSREYDPFPTKGKYHALDFDTLLKQAQQNLKR
uniref:PPARG related coactivator 1 n=1 Tax=Poecilia reticulata TaxID=8081 RepID=A0A3P9Q9N5_POERE